MWLDDVWNECVAGWWIKEKWKLVLLVKKPVLLDVALRRGVKARVSDKKERETNTKVLQTWYSVHLWKVN